MSIARCVRAQHTHLYTHAFILLIHAPTPYHSTNPLHTHSTHPLHTQHCTHVTLRCLASELVMRLAGSALDPHSDSWEGMYANLHAHVRVSSAWERLETQWVAGSRRVGGVGASVYMQLTWGSGSRQACSRQSHPCACEPGVHRNRARSRRFWLVPYTYKGVVRLNVAEERIINNAAASAHDAVKVAAGLTWNTSRCAG